MSPKELTLLYHETDSPMMVMWPDERYRELMSERVNSIITRIMAGTMPPPVSNGLNIFSSEGNLPTEVCYPPFGLAKKLAQEYQKWINELQKGVKDADALIKSYEFTFNRREQGFVRFFDTNERVRTGTVVFSYLTPVSSYLPGGTR